jgi:hypothetical protein
MNSDEQLTAAFRRPALPWPGETGGYERFLRRRARHARRVRAGVGAALVALLALVAATAAVHPLAPRDRQSAAPAPPPRPGYDHRLQDLLFGGGSAPAPYHPVEGPVVVASGGQGGSRWTLGAERAYELPPFPGVLLAAPNRCVGFHHGGLAADCSDEAVQVTRDSVGASGKSAVWGMVPTQTALVRIEVRGHRPVQVRPLAAAPRYDRRYYLTFLPRSYSLDGQGDIVPVDQVVALDGRGRELARWNWRWPIDYTHRSPGSRATIAQLPSRVGAWRLDGFHHQRSQCVELRPPAAAKVAAGTIPICEADPGWLAANLRPFGSCAGGVLVGYGVAPGRAATMRFTFANATPVQARTVPAPAGFDGTFYLVGLPPRATGIRVAALDQAGATIASSPLAGCHD